MNKQHLDGYIKTCVSIISGSILIVIIMFACLFTYVIFFDSNETTQIERRQEHIENHIKEAEKLDEIIRVLEEINKNLDGEKIKKFYNSDLYIKIIYGIPALVSGTFAFILFLIFTVQIIHESFFKEEISYEEMISQYRYNHRVFHEKDMERMDRIIELMEEIKIKTDNN